MHGQTIFVLVLDCTSVSISILKHLCKCADYTISVWVCCCRMDMVINAGKSRKNVDAFVQLPPDATLAIDLFIDTRAFGEHVHIMIFARINANTPMPGHSEWQELANSCEFLKFPKRITSRQLQAYIATVSQVCYKFVTVFVV